MTAFLVSLCQVLFLPVLSTYEHCCTLGSCSCFTIPFQANLRQSYRGSISATAQCIETQLLPQKGSGRDLQIMTCWSLFRQVAYSWRNLHHIVSTCSKVFPFNLSFSFLFSFSFLLTTFQPIFSLLYQKSCK